MEDTPQGLKVAVVMGHRQGIDDPAGAHLSGHPPAPHHPGLTSPSRSQNTAFQALQTAMMGDQSLAGFIPREVDNFRKADILN